MDHPILDILGAPTPFLDRVFENLTKDGVAYENWYLDHICYRTTTADEYETIKAQLLPYSTILSQNIIGGREILVVELNQPIVYANRNITVLEIPRPKSGRPYPSGYEHIELVINQSFEALMKQHPDLKWDTKELKKTVNPGIRLFYDNISIKFHHKPLKFIIEEES